ncbi:hypothetical protein MS3_00005778 [Schistosoma haematobium]|uniref:Trematode Eggshell Synthesis domain containing protein n=1 Tax=Schistosoma haematobium TaxID=6185 RepID=A0A922LL95_SCHHA|nr:hypothetical protein MS3_00005778 [Schistosoma haematobium]KAH9588342.1 hypothetical protein MS3_00005778 [Schistosoma haematobium]CAH8563180.1 unnamed protein product [Schistosoma haematobium]
MRTYFMCLLLAIALDSILYLKGSVTIESSGDNRSNETIKQRISDSRRQDSDIRKTETRDNRNRQSRENKEDSQSSTNDDVGFQSSQRKFQLKYSNRKRSDIYTTGYQTFLGKRRRGSKSHVKTIFRRRSGYDRNGQKKRTTTFESYGEADSFDRKKIRDVFDVNGYISEGRRRSKLGGYIQEEQHAFMSGGHKSQLSRNDGKFSEGGSQFANETHNHRSHSDSQDHIKISANSTLQRRRR